MGSRQASLTIWARWRGGKSLWPAYAGLVQEQFLESTALVTATEPPHRRPVILQPRGHHLDRLPCSNSENRPRVLNLKPGKATSLGNRLQYRDILGRDRDPTRLPTDHATLLEGCRKCTGAQRESCHSKCCIGASQDH